MMHFLLRPFTSCLLLTLSLTLSISAEITSHTRLSGHFPKNVMHYALFLNNLNINTELQITFTLPLRNQEELQELIERIYDPADKEHYGEYLTSAEFIERFAPTPESYNEIIAYAEKLGFIIQQTHLNRLLLNVKGPVKSIQSAFNLHLNEYLLPNGRKFYAPTNDPEVPISIAALIGGIIGLDNQAKWHPSQSCRPYRHRKKNLDTSSSNTSSKVFPSGPRGGFSPSDIIAAYNLQGVSQNGSGQIIALFELASYEVQDIITYAQHFNLPAPQLRNILVDGGSGSETDPEVVLDIELAIALAPKSQIYVYEGPNSDQGVLDTYNRIATDNIAKQVSTSWGLGENFMSRQYLQAENAIFQQMAVQGQTIYAASGDSGAYDDYPDDGSRAKIVDDPASQPYVVAVGGTSLKVNPRTGAYQSESVWNDGLGNGASGGGVSAIWQIPSWQTSVSSASSRTHRNTPDIALNADPNTGYSIYYNGTWEIYGGTSCAAPLWAAFTACVNQKRVVARRPVLGFANPAFYAIGSGVSYKTNFHDITSGNNLYYNAKIGYDNASGWGSFNGANLFQSLTTGP